MTLVKSAAVAALTLAIATPGLAQTLRDQTMGAQTTGAQTPDQQPAAAQPSGDGPLANDGPYAGTSRREFYQPDDRINQIQSEIQRGALAGSQARHAMAQLTAIRGELKYRVARHNGDLRDWDRELINQKLDALVAQYPALRS